jgi:hypothetical protein
MPRGAVVATKYILIHFNKQSIIELLELMIWYVLQLLVEYRHHFTTNPEHNGVSSKNPIILNTDILKLIRFDSFPISYINVFLFKYCVFK